MSPRSRSRFRLLAAGLATLTLAAAAAAVTSASAAAAAPATADTTVQYAVNRPICSTPADPAAMRCFGLRRVDVPRGTAGAYRYRALDGDSSGAVPAGVGAGPAGGYTPAQLAAAYGLNPRVKRSNLTVGIVLWHDAPNVLADLNRFDAHYGLRRETSRSFRKVNERGRATPLPRRDAGSASEIALDTQAVRAVCNTCRILLVEADGPYDKNLANAVNTAVRLGADVVTNSYGTPERRFAARTVRAYRHPGVAVVAATGDSGWYGWDYGNDPRTISDNAPMFPATSPSVIAVGGTTLTRDARTGRWVESVWNNNGAHDARGSALQRPLGASGGGCSRYFAAPNWQRFAAGYAATGCGGRRSATDVAMVADPRTGFAVYDSYGSHGWVTIGGTSLSSPLAAGMLALSGGPRGARYPASALYANASVSPFTRFDVSAGGNGFCGTDEPKACSDAVYAATLLDPTRNPNKLGLGVVDCSFPRNGGESVPTTARAECTARAGFDGPSGVGTPRSTRLFVRSDPYLGVRWSGTVRHGRAKAFRARIVTPLPGTRITSLTWQWGDGRKATVTRGAAATHAYRKAGRYTVTLTSRDNRGQLSTATGRVRVR